MSQTKIQKDNSVNFVVYVNGSQSEHVLFTNSDFFLDYAKKTQPNKRSVNQIDENFLYSDW